MPLRCGESEHDAPSAGYLLILTSVGTGTVAVVEKEGKNCCIARATGDGVTIVGTVPEVTNYVGDTCFDTSAASNDNETLTLENAGVSNNYSV